MMPLQPVFGVLVLIFAVSTVYSQTFLVLEKVGTKKRHEYYPGDQIIFKLKDEDIFHTDEIIDLGDSAIIFESGQVPLKEIKKISLSNRRTIVRGFGKSLIIGGIGYTLTDLFNKTIRPGNVYFDGKVVRSSAIIAGSGLGLVLLSKKKVRVRKNWRLRIVDI